MDGQQAAEELRKWMDDKSREEILDEEPRLASLIIKMSAIGWKMAELTAEIKGITLQEYFAGCLQQATEASARLIVLTRLGPEYLKKFMMEVLPD